MIRKVTRAYDTFIQGLFGLFEEYPGLFYLWAGAALFIFLVVAFATIN